jgi:hypothetical protein
MMQAVRSPRGVITKLFGAILMMLGLLDSVLTLRGGVPAYEFLLLVLLGAGVFAVGAVRAGSRFGTLDSPVDMQARERPGAPQRANP